MKKLIHLITLFIFIAINAQEKSVPFFINGEAQVVGSFKDETKWIRHDLWVETSFDSDDDGKMDRMHVDVTRPAQTEDGLKLPRIITTLVLKRFRVEVKNKVVVKYHIYIGCLF